MIITKQEVTDLSKRAANEASNALTRIVSLVDEPQQSFLVLFQAMVMLNGEAGAAILCLLSLVIGENSLESASDGEQRDATILSSLMIANYHDQRTTTNWYTILLWALNKFELLFNRRPEIKRLDEILNVIKQGSESYGLK